MHDGSGVEMMEQTEIRGGGEGEQTDEGGTEVVVVVEVKVKVVVVVVLESHAFLPSMIYDTLKEAWRKNHSKGLVVVTTFTSIRNVLKRPIISDNTLGIHHSSELRH